MQLAMEEVNEENAGLVSRDLRERQS